MDFIPLLLIAVALGMDTFSVALGIGAAAGELSFRPVFRLSFHFGLFQTLMAVIGWYGGMTLTGVIEDYDHWLAFGLLTLVGGKMIYESLNSEEGRAGVDLTRGMSLIVLSIATSIDSLAVGISFAFLHMPILFASLLIGLTSFIMTVTGFIAGDRLGSLLGKRAELVGGLILIGIGLKILLEHLYS